MSLPDSLIKGLKMALTHQFEQGYQINLKSDAFQKIYPGASSSLETVDYWYVSTWRAEKFGYFLMARLKDNVD